MYSTSGYAQTVTIGSQVWANTNLNASTYRNGDIIPQVQDKEAWSNLTTGAWCYYDNAPSNGMKYGKIYNWHALNDPRGIAPVGYHIPTDLEWATLINFLGGENVAGTKLKNALGFSGLLGGNRNGNGDFEDVGINGSWWCNSGSSSSSAWFCGLDYYDGISNRINFDMQFGFSIRCIKD